MNSKYDKKKRFGFLSTYVSDNNASFRKRRSNNNGTSHYKEAFFIVSNRLAWTVAESICIRMDVKRFDV